MKSKIFGVVLILLAFASKAQPPNNSIFFGSVGDGFSKQSFSIASNEIFLGGSGDGFGIATNGVAANNIFRGSIGDGFNFSSSNVVSNTIFLGGIGDGFNNAGNAAPSNNIFVGGIGDGFNNSGNAAPSNNIFLGGAGDGWSSVYRPQGPLPVTLLYFTARKQTATSVLVEWKTSLEINSKSFDVERSNDAVRFAKIGTVAAAGNSSTAIAYNFTDNNPVKGMNYYRLKQVDVDGKFVYSPARLVVFDGLDASTVKYYPNPTSGILTIEIYAVNSNEKAVINITNAAGIVVNQYRVASISGNKIQIDFSRYAKGTYFIQVRTPTLNSTQRVVLN